MILSILICTISKRKEFLDELLGELTSQTYGFCHVDINSESKCIFLENAKVEIIVNYSENDTIGKKRNELLELAKGEYLCFFDDDDYPSPDYIDRLLNAVSTKPDCVSLRGIMTTNGKNPEIFEHSLKYKEWKTTKNKIKYERFPNHLNCIKSEIAKQFKFAEINHGEDFDWSKRLNESGFLKTEYYLDNVIYYYRYITNK